MMRSLPVIQPESPRDGRKPPWLKVRAPGGPNYMRLKHRMREWNLHSVCEEARCPNIGECWEDATASFMILGDVCTRHCGYCAIAHGRPTWEDRDELLATLRDRRGVGVSILTLGQYLRPSAQHLPVARYYHPAEFAELAALGRGLGFSHVEAGPLVRSSYHAKRQADAAQPHA